MKTRRALQIVVGILSLLVALCLLVAFTVFVFLLYAREDVFETGTQIANTLNQGLQFVANTMGLNGQLAILVPVLFYGLPFLLLLLAAILLFSHKTAKQSKYVAGNVLALTGATIFTVFTVVCAKSILSGNAASFYVRLAAVGLLGLFVIFVGAALGVKRKREQVAETAEQTDATIANTTTYETAEATETSDYLVVDEIANDAYVPDPDITVNDVMQNIYGESERELSPEVIAKINKVRLLYETDAITNDEYLKLVNIYLSK